MEQFLGKWKSVSSSGFEEYLKALQVSLPVRKIAMMQNPSYEVKDNGDGTYSATQLTAFKNHGVSFKLDEEFNENTPDGRKTQEHPKILKWFDEFRFDGLKELTTFSLLDGKLIQKQMLNGVLSSELTREIVEDGQLKTSATAGDAVYIRMYKKAD